MEERIDWVGEEVEEKSFNVGVVGWRGRGMSEKKEGV